MACPTLTPEQIDSLVRWSLHPEYVIVGYADDGTPIYAPSYEVDEPTIVPKDSR